MNLTFLTDEENELFEYFATRFFANRDERYLEFHGSPWSVDQDAVVYIDEEGADTASFGWGAEAVLEKHLSVEDIEHMNQNGYIVKDKKIFAYSRFLIEHFIKAAVLLKGADARQEETMRLIRSIGDGYDEHGDPLEGEAAEQHKEQKRLGNDNE